MQSLQRLLDHICEITPAESDADYYRTIQNLARNAIRVPLFIWMAVAAAWDDLSTNASSDPWYVTFIVLTVAIAGAIVAVPLVAIRLVYLCLVGRLGNY